MPAPFDNGVMRFAWLSVMLTDWIGDAGKLSSLKAKFLGPVIYGDTSFYTGHIINKKIVDNNVELTIKISGHNQLNNPIVSAESIVQLSIPKASFKKKFTFRTKPELENKPLANSFISLFEQIVAKTPHAVAVKDSFSEINYTKLNQRANRVANMLTRLGAKSNTIIGVFLNRDIDWIIALLSIFKCGASYLPMDVNASRERTEFILKDSTASILITNSVLGDTQFSDGIKTFFLDIENVDIQKQSSDFQKPPILSEGLAYLMYTSGSSGKSKAVCISNRALFEYINVLPKSLPLTEDDCYLSTASFTFSASMRQLCFPLAYGSRLIIANEKQIKDPLLLALLMEKEKVTIWDTVPSVWVSSFERIIAHKTNGRHHMIDSLGKIFLTGEALAWDQVKQWYRMFKKDICLINLYSQTETTGSVAAFKITSDQTFKKGIVPIGKCLPDTRIFLLDENLNPVQSGETGEICVSNNRLATGYAGDNDLTSKHFIDYQGAPVYRTGDLSRLNNNGCFEFIGRQDRRIKLRGFRIDLDEIESVLTDLGTYKVNRNT